MSVCQSSLPTAARIHSFRQRSSFIVIISFMSSYGHLRASPVSRIYSRNRVLHVSSQLTLKSQSDMACIQPEQVEEVEIRFSWPKHLPDFCELFQILS